LKKTFFFLLFVCSNLLSQAQQDATAATLNNIQNIPAFKIFTAPDSTAFTNTQLKKGKPFVLMFFSPDCDHCQKETKELLAYKRELKDIEIVMASPASYSLIKGFYQDYNIASMPNIMMGQDLNYVLGSKYQLRTYPSLFVYDAAGKLAKAFVGNVGVPAILEAVK
jgi:thiol-disulfide isomerase/thioredoxin